MAKMKMKTRSPIACATMCLLVLACPSLEERDERGDRGGAGEGEGEGEDKGESDVGGEGGGASDERLAICGVACSRDEDCAEGQTCRAGVCEFGERCDVLSCTASLSSWLQGFKENEGFVGPCDADAVCFDGFVCIDIGDGITGNGAGLCAIVDDESISCTDYGAETLETLDIAGNTVAVCVAPGKCLNDTFCVEECDEQSDCIYGVCDTERGFCQECVGDQGCDDGRPCVDLGLATGGNPSYEGRNVCGCSSVDQCDFLPIYDACINNVCGCSGDEVCTGSGERCVTL